jgi:GTPase SAR1 family protein
VTIAVVGEENAGKTSFVKCALDMKNPPSSAMNKKKMSLNGSVYIVHLMEVDLTQIQLDQDKKIIWPRAGRDKTPTIDAVLVLHDATKPDRLSLTTNLICRFSFKLNIRIGLIFPKFRLIGSLGFSFLASCLQMRCQP